MRKRKRGAENRLGYLTRELELEKVAELEAVDRVRETTKAWHEAKEEAADAGAEFMCAADEIAGKGSNGEMRDLQSRLMTGLTKKANAGEPEETTNGRPGGHGRR